MSSMSFVRQSEMWDESQKPRLVAQFDARMVETLAKQDAPTKFRVMSSRGTPHLSLMLCETCMVMLCPEALADPDERSTLGFFGESREPIFRSSKDAEISLLQAQLREQQVPLTFSHGSFHNHTPHCSLSLSLRVNRSEPRMLSPSARGDGHRPRARCPDARQGLIPLWKRRRKNKKKKRMRRSPRQRCLAGHPRCRPAGTLAAAEWG